MKLAIEPQWKGPFPDEADTLYRFDFYGEVFIALLSGGAYWPAQGALLVSDLHLEKMASHAPGGQLLPPYDTGATLRRLADDIEATGATRVVCLGDSFHRDAGTQTLLETDRALLDNLIEHREWTWIAGNHDPAPHGLGGVCCASLSVGPLILRHEPQPGARGEVAGHLHPAARVRINGRSVRRPCLAYDDERMILPAYGVSTGSLNVLGGAFAGLFDLPSLNVVMLGRDRLYAVNTRRLVDG